MKNVKILDCTLRDGGYINNWQFGKKNIKTIINKLEQANIDYIEIGYLNMNKENDINSTKISSILSNKNINNYKYVCMINYGEFDINKLPNYNDKSLVCGIRLAFHKEDVFEALEICKIIKEKGYLLFVQPMVTKRYTDNEILEMLKIVNQIQPYAFYFVDSFGSMDEKDVKYYLRIIESNLNLDIPIGFHSHNNLQLSFSNVVTFIKKSHKDRKIIIDSSVLGMGRGAGNLPTELIVDYLNKNEKTDYDVIPLLEISDNILSKIKAKKNWGYCLPYYLSAINNCHPSYAISFMERNTLTTVDINNLINMIDETRKVKYDKNYADSLYEKYNNKTIEDEDNVEKLKAMIGSKNVFLLGPGKSVKIYKNLITEYINNDENYSISVNNNLGYNTDALFFSNRKRYEEQDNLTNNFVLLTSNVKNKMENNGLIFDYNKYLINEDIKDNSLLVLLNILRKIKIDKIILAGFDGFSENMNDNFYDENIQYSFSKEYTNELNEVMRHTINEYRKYFKIVTITPSINIDNSLEDRR